MDGNLSGTARIRMLRFQRDELTGSFLYASIGRRQKNTENKAALLQLAEVEKRHYGVWKQYTETDATVYRGKLLWYQLIGYLLGFTFTIKLMERRESLTRKEISRIEAEIPDIRNQIYADEQEESPLLDLLDEERLQYVGAMVLGLNDALVELTGTIAGLTFALGDTRLVALSGIITGISATLSMAASNYLAERADGNPTALKSSVYTGVAYLITVALMVSPYLLLPSWHYAPALIIMLLIVVLIILLFNFYISVAQSQPFLRRFGEMALISLGVALIYSIISIKGISPMSRIGLVISRTTPNISRKLWMIFVVNCTK